MTALAFQKAMQCNWTWFNERVCLVPSFLNFRRRTIDRQPLSYSNRVLSNAIAGVGGFIGRVQSQDEVFFRDAHV